MKADTGEAGKTANRLQIRRALVATDFSVPSREAFRFALPLLERWEADVHLVHVFATDYPFSSMTVPPLVVPPEEIERRVLSQLKDFAAQETIALPRENLHAIPGTAWKEICRLARELPIDLIASATRGQTGLKHLALGSTAERIVRHAPCPVLVVHPLDRNQPHRAGFETIFAPVDFSECGMVGLEAARAIAREFDARLVLFHSLDLHYYSTNPEFMLYDLPPIIDAAEKAAREQLDEMIELVRREKIAGETVLGCGHAGERICHEARERAADLIVTSTHGRTGLAHVFIGSTAEYVVRHAPCPVLVIPSHTRSGTALPSS